MVTLEEIELENFLNVKQATIPFRDQGFVLIIGENGCGKSALFTEAPYYCLYGESFRYGPRPGREVIRRGASSFLCSGKVHVDGVGDLLIVRAKKQKKRDFPDGLSVWLDGKDISRGSDAATQEWLNDLYAMGPKTFINSVLFTKDTLQFPLLPDSKKKEILDDLLRLDVLDRARTAGEEGRKELAATVATLTNRIDLHEEQIPEIKAVIKELEVRNAAWQKEHDAQVKGLAAAQVKASAAAKKIKVKEDVTRSEHLRAQSAMSTMQKKVDLMRDALRISREAYIKTQMSAETAVTTQRRAITDLQVRIANRANILGRDCPKCGQPVGHTVEQWVDERKEELVEATKQLDPLLEALRVVEKVGETLEVQKDGLTALTEKFEDQQKGVRRTAQDLEKLTEQREQADGALTIARERHEAALAQTNHIEPRIAEERERLAGLKKKVVAEREKVTVTEALLVDEKTLDACFGSKGARLLLLDRVVPSLNAEAARLCGLLETAMTVSFNVRGSDQSYAGTFEVKVENPMGAADYRGDSSGERRRVDLVILFSHLRLASSRGAKSFNQSIFDEPFENLDVSGQEAVLNLLTHESKNKSSTFVITHSAFELTNRAAQVWRVGRGGEISFN